MRAKRSKTYKKTMAIYTSAFKFREPFQVLVDSEFVKQISGQKMVDVQKRLEDILGGPVKMSGWLWADLLADTALPVPD